MKDRIGQQIGFRPNDARAVSNLQRLLEIKRMNPRTPWPSRSILFLLLPAISVALCLPGCGDKSGPASVGNDPAAPAELIGPPAGGAPAIAPTQGTAEDVLKKTIQAYKSAGTYRDAAIVKLAGTKDGQRQEMSYPHAVVMQRPNKLRM